MATTGETLLGGNASQYGVAAAVGRQAVVDHLDDDPVLSAQRGYPGGELAWWDFDGLGAVAELAGRGRRPLRLTAELERAPYQAFAAAVRISHPSFAVVSELVQIVAPRNVTLTAFGPARAQRRV